MKAGVEVGILGRRRTALLALCSVMLLSMCTVAFELEIVALLAYEVSDHVSMLSMIFGLYLFCMGLGAWGSRAVGGDAARAYVACCLFAALAGALSVPGLTAAYYGTRSFWPLLVLVTALVAAPCGAALPLAVRALAERKPLAASVSLAMGLDYIGALGGALLLSLWLLPVLGLERASAATGAAAWCAGLAALAAVGELRARASQRLIALGIVTAGVLVLAGWRLPGLLDDLRDYHLRGKTIYLVRTPYQEIRVRRGESERLYLSNQVQYDSRSEYIYHELLVHPAFALHGRPRSVLVLGGGDGLALREIWRYPEVERVTLVDIDPAMPRYGRTFPGVVSLNLSSFADPRLTVVYEDAWLYADRVARDPAGLRYDVVVSDLPSPTNVSLSRLYTVTFYRRLVGLLAPAGVVVVQSGTLDPRDAGVPKCIEQTLRAAGLDARIYHAELLAYTLATKSPFPQGEALRARLKLKLPTRYLNDAILPALFQVPLDVRPAAQPPNDLETHVILREL